MKVYLWAAPPQRGILPGRRRPAQTISKPFKLMIQAEVAVDYFTLRALDAQGRPQLSIQVFTKSSS